MDINAMREKRAQLHEQAKAVVQAARDENRDLTEEETAKVDELLDEVEGLKGSIERAERLEAQGAELEQSTRRVPPRQPDAGPDVSVRDRREDDPKCGFKTLGEFGESVRKAAIGAGRDERLDISAAAATTYANESTGADGGFLVPPEFSAEVRRLALEEDSFFAMTDQNPLQGNSMRFPADETTPWGTNGVRAFWEAEGDTGSEKKPVLKSKELRLHKLLALVPTTDELLADTTALDRYLQNQMGRSIRWKLNEALVNGTGAGQPMGVANANAKVQVTRDTASEVKAVDVAGMYSRLLPSAQRNAVWLAHNDVLPQLVTMSIANQPIWTAPNQGIQNAPGGMLLGRPVIFTQTAQTLGTAGDLRLVDWSQYVTAEKQAGIEYSMSMHLYFDADQMAFKARFRADGQPWLASSVSQKRGSNKLSTIVELN